jgi:hypothetical protein
LLLPCFQNTYRAQSVYKSNPDLGGANFIIVGGKNGKAAVSNVTASQVSSPKIKKLANSGICLYSSEITERVEGKQYRWFLVLRPKPPVKGAFAT